ncbi:MAG: HD domain-containing phosphohydrolase [Sporolactobacillus sp.]|uniref:HD-GYP domain-containing protein n=1 Tax=Sporolactobacillus sp. STSJ-5 TaxID=2965076 RepID=UPI0021035082|nr:HD domain-containing phosphohydrolase [Sporolactobacillus sp. STSJ-5]MCQ2010966.1 HD domain-containing protein [Sporolactobacillus sp. STSJ-5]
MDTNLKTADHDAACIPPLILISCYFLSCFITLIVYLTDGTSNVYSNFMYLPIAIVSASQGKKPGMIHAAVSALLIGPFMPLDVSLHQSQPLENWMIRLTLYVIIAFVIGFFADYYKQEFDRNLRHEKELYESQIATIYSLVRLLESRDVTSGFHVERVSTLCKLLAEYLQRLPKYKTIINDVFIDNLYKSSPLHDIGKVGIPDKILLKPGKLTVEEFEVMKTHTTIGANTLTQVQDKYSGNKFLELGIELTRWHHERWDGTGYPDGLKGEKIPLSARIVAIADVYEALRSKRVYKSAYSHEKATQIIKEYRSSHFDPKLVDVFLEHADAFEAAFDQFSS